MIDPRRTILSTIISGGQTGADRAALDFAIAHGIPHGGWCPRGRIAEDGVLDMRYRLRETESKNYRVREWLAAHPIAVLNVAGPRERKCPGIYLRALAFLEVLYATLDDSAVGSRPPPQAGRPHTPDDE